MEFVFTFPLFILLTIPEFIAIIFLFYGGYLMMMPLLRAYREDRMTDAAYWIGGPWALLFVIGDVLFNWTIACVIFLDIPREFMTTQRLERYYHFSLPVNRLQLYRYNIAHWV